MSFSLIPLLVVAPLGCAPLMLFINSHQWRWTLAVITSAFTMFASFILMIECWSVGSVGYPMGNWPPPVGIEYRIDLLSGYFLCFIGLTGFAAILAGRNFIAREIEPQRQGVFVAAYLLLLSGLCGITITGDIFNIFVFLEISSLASYTLIALGRDRRGLVASLRYLLIGTVGTTFFLIGIGLLYAKTGSLNLRDLGVLLAGQGADRIYQTAIACIVIGTAIKAAIVPFHLWLPPCYSYSPSIAQAFLAAAATKTSLYILYRVGFSVCGWDTFHTQMHAMQALFWLSCFGAVFCPWKAWRQNDVRMLLAWSSLGQVAYIVLAMGLATDAGRQASLTLLLSHAIIKPALFLSLACIAIGAGAYNLKALSGQGYRHKPQAAVFTIAALGLAGIPLTSGFIAKWHLYLAAIEAGQWLALLAIIAGSLLGLAYVFRVLATLWHLDPAPQARAKAVPTEWLALCVIAALAALILLLGIAPAGWIEVTKQVNAV